MAPLRQLGVQFTPEVVDREKWNAFWDAPLMVPGAPKTNMDLPRKPEEIRRAPGRVVARCRAADLLRFAREVHVGLGSAGNHEGCVPEGVPLFAGDHLGRELYAEVAQRRHLLLRQTPPAAGDLKLGCEISSQDDPGAATLAGRQFGD